MFLWFTFERNLALSLRRLRPTPPKLDKITHNSWVLTREFYGSICSGDHGSVDGWTVIQAKAKAKKTKEAPHRRKTEESIIGVNGIHKVVNGNAIAADGIGV